MRGKDNSTYAVLKAFSSYQSRVVKELSRFGKKIPTGSLHPLTKRFSMWLETIFFLRFNLQFYAFQLENNGNFVRNKIHFSDFNCNIDWGSVGTLERWNTTVLIPINPLAFHSGLKVQTIAFLLQFIKIKVLSCLRHIRGLKLSHSTRFLQSTLVKMHFVINTEA